MNLQEQPKLAQMLEEVCTIYGRDFSDILVHAYYRVLKVHSFEALSKAVIRILSDEQRRQIMPTAAEIRAVASHLEVTSGEQRYLPCQHHGCEALVAWPPAGLVNEHSYYCPRHKPEWQADWSPEKQDANRITLEEKQEIFATATAKARAFLRSIPLVARQMTEIPITAEEQAAADADAVPLRAKAFEETATGPGVNPSVFLHGRVTEDTAWMDGYRKGAEIMAAGGFRYDAERAVWTRGRQTLSDDQMGRMDEELLRMFVGRRG